MERNGERCNILLITVDSLRADVCCRPGANSTPNLDMLAERAAVFHTAIAQGPYTTASIPSLLSGKYPARLKRIASDKIAGVVAGETPTLPAYLKQAGYHTAAFHSNPLLSHAFGYNRNFDSFYDHLGFHNLKLSQRMSVLLNHVRRAFGTQPYLPAEGLSKKAIRWLEKARKPFFLWLHYMDPHGPYLAHGGFRYLNKFRSERLWRKAVRSPEAVSEGEAHELRAAYQQEVAYLDQQLGLFFNALDTMGLLDASLVVFTADHGDAFGEHGQFSHPHQLYEELIRVPLYIRMPGVQPRTIEEPVGLVSLAPTILDFAGVKANEPFDGPSLRPLIERGDKSTLPRYVITEAEFSPYYIGAIRTVEWKFILNEREGTKELYCLVNDPEEQRNVISEERDVARGLEAMLREYLSGSKPAQNGHSERGLQAGLSQAEREELEDRLRALGYL